MRTLSLTWLTLLLLGLAAAAPSAAAPADDDEKLLREHRAPTDGPGLLDYLRRRFTTSVSDQVIRALIEQLGDDSFEKREEASRRLTALGPRAKKQLQDALRHDDLEVRARAAACLRQLDRDGVSNQLLAAAVRVLARRAPAGAAALLLDQLPALGDDPLVAEIREVLPALALRGGKAEPALVDALKDRNALRREAAALALARVDAPGVRPALRGLLADPERLVRQRVAMALARLGEKEAIPVLIEQMDQPLSPAFGHVEEVLMQLAGPRSPHLADDSEAARRRYRQAWQAWWKETAARADLRVLAAPDRAAGGTVVVLLDDNQILDLDSDNKVRWKIDDVQMPLDLQRLPGDRVLLAEYKANRVTERNRKGEVVWQRKVEEPLVAQRLVNGHTLIANRREVIEIDAAGKQVFSYAPPAGAQIMRACKVPGGDVLLVTQLGVTRFHRISRFGKDLRAFGVEVGTSGGRLDVLPSGNVLVPEMYNNRICEYDNDGRIVREVVVQQPITAAALPNGHILATSMTEKRAVELNRAGKEVWEYRRDTRVTRAVRY